MLNFFPPSTRALAGAATLLSLLGCGGSSLSHDPSPYDVTAASVLVDVDGDGRLDPVNAVSTYGAGAPHPGFLSLRFQNPSPSGTFQAPVRLGAGMDPYAIATGDLNGDARPDFAVANTQTLPGAIQANAISIILSAPPPGTFLAAQTLSLGIRDPLDVAIADLNGDGLTDIAVAARGGNNVLIFFRAPGPTVTFAPPTPTSVSLSGEPTGITTADLNGDGYPDLAITTQADVVSVLLQNSATPGTFAAPLNLPVGHRPVAVRAGDIDGDGRLDLAVANWGSPGGGLSLLLRDPSAPASFQFQPSAHYDTGDSYSGALAIGDLDGDGRADVVVTNAGNAGFSGSLAILFQDSAHPGLLRTVDLYRGYFGPSSVAIGDLNGDGHPDLLIADGDPSVRFQNPAQPGLFEPPYWLKH